MKPRWSAGDLCRRHCTSRQRRPVGNATAEPNTAVQRALWTYNGGFMAEGSEATQMTDMLDTTRSDGSQAATRDGTASSAAHETRQRIVETANKLFHVYGYQKTTVADIARELGMSPANVYRFFASKAELTKALEKLK